ncbi:hypothetical protein [Streptomyces sp. NPDC055287]
MDEAASVRRLAEALTTLIEQRLIAQQSVAPVTHLLSGAMNEAAPLAGEDLGGPARRPDRPVAEDEVQLRRLTSRR